MSFLARNTRRIVVLMVLVVCPAFESGDDVPDFFAKTARGESESAGTTAEVPVTVTEARGRARVLHDTIHATLRVVHREYYREDERLPIPSLTLESVFDELARKYNIKVRWLSVNTQAMNVDHAPRDDFEKAAVKALVSGQEEFDLVENGVYRHAGVIVLSSQCLKCHLPNRTSTKDRAAGLVIAMPVKTTSEDTRNAIPGP